MKGLRFLLSSIILQEEEWGVWKICAVILPQEDRVDTKECDAILDGDVFLKML